MSPEPETPEQPTPQQAIAIAEAAKKAAEEAKTAAEAKTNMEQAIEQEAEAQGTKISEQDARMIAETTIAVLKEAGAFDEVRPPAPAPEPEPAAPVEQNPPAPAPEEVEEAPARKTLAERFQAK